MSKTTRDYIEAAEKALEAEGEPAVHASTNALLALVSAVNDLKRDVIYEIGTIRRERA